MTTSQAEAVPPWPVWVMTSAGERTSTLSEVDGAEPFAEVVQQGRFAAEIEMLHLRCLRAVHVRIKMERILDLAHEPGLELDGAGPLHFLVPVKPCSLRLRDDGREGIFHQVGDGKDRGFFPDDG